MQGGIHPEYTGATYLDICRTVKAAVPGMHVHAFSPLEVWQGAATLHVSLEEFLGQLKTAGLGTLPGTAAEILHDDVRRDLCPDKLSAGQWLEDGNGTSGRFQDHRHHHVWPHRPFRSLGQAFDEHPRAAGAHGRIH